ncbi:type II toxin-antitoxin system PemK/MazF family toxin [Acidithiobacillus sp. YTS05]|nr:type II toxin-antitoxin system PemK/MazF family toxin [Acidithiobacillus sp. YTS05]
MTYEPGQVLRVPFPFTDRDASKNRPALVLSAEGFNQQSGHLVLAMITSAKNTTWPLDYPIQDLRAAGLPAPSVVRGKLFTLDARLIRGALGHLSPADKERLSENLKQICGNIV